MNGSTRILGVSTADCAGCGILHRSRYEVAGGTVVYTIECPKDEKSTLVSSDAQRFETFRSREPVGRSGTTGSVKRFHSHILSITDHCNCECPICFAECRPAGQRFLSVEAACQAALLVKAHGGNRISLSGGEPTTHPYLVEVVRTIHRQTGLAPILVTNGLSFVKDDRLLLALKAAGLRRIHLQFDTLNSDTYRAMRGRDDVDEKRKAVDRIVAAGLRLGLIATVCEWNLEEVGGLLEYSQRFVPAIRMLAYQPAVPVGRFPQHLQTVTREDVIRVLTRPGGQYELNADDFAPFPGLRSDDHTAHPDCSAHALLVSDGIRSRPWRRNSETQASRIDHRRGPRHPFIVSILSFMQPHTRDEERLRRCTVASVAGPSLVPLCSLSCGGATKPLADRVARVPGCPGTPGGVVGLERASVKQPAAVEGSDVLAGTVLAHS